MVDMDTQYLERSKSPPMTYRIGFYHSREKPIWMTVSQWANHLVTVYNSKGHSRITVVHSSCNLKGEYTPNEADPISIANVTLGEETCRGYGASTEVIISSNYNIWAMLQNPDGTDSSADCIIQDHMHLLSTK